MKIKDVYNELLRQNKNCLIFVKSGMFYTIYDEGANIVNIIFKYQLRNNRVGFPIQGINKVINELEKLNINYIVYNFDDTSIYKEFENNVYENYYHLYRKKEYDEQCKKILIERIIYLIDLSKNNYNKIKEFIDEYEV